MRSGPRFTAWHGRCRAPAAAGYVAALPSSRGTPRRAPRWRTHGLPPQSGTVTADTPPRRIAAIGGAGGHDFRAGWRDDGRDPLSVPSPPPAGRRGSREPEPVDNALGRAAEGLAVGLAATPRPGRRLARPAAPQPPPPAPNVRPPRPGGQAPTFGVTGLAARPRSPSSGTTPHRPAAVAAVVMADAPSAP